MASTADPFPVHPLKAWRTSQGRRGKGGRWIAKTVAEAAAEQGVSHVTWWQWEQWPDQPRHSMPRHDEMEALCRRTGLQHHMFFLSYREQLQADLRQAS